MADDLSNQAHMSASRMGPGTDRVERPTSPGLGAATAEQLANGGLHSSPEIAPYASRSSALMLLLTGARSLSLSVTGHTGRAL